MNIESSLQWFYDRLSKVYYSMNYRLGQVVSGRPNFDCSSAVYFSLKQGGFFPADMRIGNTDSLFGDLERNGWVKVTDGTKQRGDTFIWGKRGASGGAAGHTGRFVDSVNVIHCSSGYNGIHIDNYVQLRGWNNNPEDTVYRYVGKDSDPNDQDVSPGAFIKFDKTFTADEVKEIGGIWQVRTNELCPVNFTWEDNGIPTEPLYEVDGEGYATIDQDLSKGSKYVLPGKFEVLDVGEDSGVWLALIEWNGLKFWVDLAVATEISKDAAGTPVPGQKPPTPPDVPPVIQEPPVVPEKPDSDTPEEEPPTQPEQPSEPPVINPKENKDMAFKPEDAEQLNIQTKKVLDADEFSPVISDQVKTIAYFVTDTGAILSGLILTLLAILQVIDAVVAITIQTAFMTALLGLKQTFRLSSKKQ